MQIIHQSTDNISNGLSSAEPESPNDTAMKYLDSYLIKNTSSSYKSTYNSTVGEAILVSTNTTPLRQITAHGAVATASAIVPPSSTKSFQDLKSENVVLIPTSSTLEQYRLQLYNYALSIDRLRSAQYPAATTMSAAAYARGDSAGVHLLVNDGNNHTFGSIEVEKESNYPSSVARVGIDRPYASAAITQGNRLALSMSLFPQRIFHPEQPKPQYSYIGLIAMAILSSAETKLVLSDIYQYILDHYPYFRARGPGWRNSIRHNLSLNDCFIKSGRSANGKGHYWAIHPANITDFRKGDFRRRKAQRKVRKHMGLSLDDAGTDSPSPPPLDLTSPTLTSASLLRLPPSGNSLTAGHEFMMAPGTHTFGCLQQKSYPLLQVPTTLVSIQAQPQMQDSYFGAAFMEQYTCIPSTVYNSRQSTREHQQLQKDQQQEHYKDNSESQLYNKTHDKPLSLLSRQSDDDMQRNSKSTYANQTATTITSKSAATAIANLYSQTGKRQFDVASLLAPDRKDCAHKISPTEHTLLNKAVYENYKECYQQEQQQQNAPAQSLHTSHLLLSSPALTWQAGTNPHRLLTLDEQDQDEIDVVANDIEEQSKQVFSVMEENDYEDPYDVIEEEEKKEPLISDTKIVSNSRSAQIYVDGENECIIDATLHRTPNSTQHQPPRPGTVVEFHMLRPEPTSEEKNLSHIPISPANSLTDYEECYATKIPSETTLTSIVASKTVAASATAHCNSESSQRSSLSQVEIPPNDPISATHRSQHVQRLLHHLNQQHQQHDTIGLDGEAQAFGRCYGTYMAAAARRIGTMQLTQIQRQLFVKHPHLQE